MHIRPLNNNVLVQPMKMEEVSAGGLVMVHSPHEKSNKAMVIATGEGRITDSGHLVPISVQPGDEVLIPRHAGTPVTAEGQDFLMMSEDDIMAVLEVG